MSTRTYQHVIDDIRAAVASPADVDSDRMATLAEEYVELCRTVQNRISECLDLVRKGETAEALRLAEHDPRLIDLMTLLDFPERETWIDLCRLLGLTAPPSLQVSHLDILQEIYQSSAGAEALRRQWCYLNIVRAPLVKRIECLRQLVQADPLNLAWQEDLHAFESARHEEIGREIQAAVKNGDRDALERLYEELNSFDWAKAPPSKLTALAEKELTKLRLRDKKERLHELAKRIHEAYAKGDVDETESLLVEFDDLRSELGVGDDASVSREVLPAREWTAQQRDEQHRLQEERRAVRALETAIDREASLEELNKLYQLATRTGRELPVELRRRYALACRERETEARRGYQFKLALVGAAATVLVATVFFVVMQVTERRQRSDVIATIRTFIQERNFDAAQEYVERLRNEKPELAGHPQVQAAVAELDTACAEEEGRRRQFEALESRIEKAIADRDPASAPIEQLEALAVSNEETAVVLKLKSRLGEVKAELEREARAAWQTAFHDLQEEIRKLETADLATLSENDFSVLRSKIEALLSDPAVPETQSAAAKALLPRIDLVKERFDEFQKFRAWLEPLTAAVGDRFEYERMLERAAAKNDAVSADCKTALQMLPWDGVDDWNDLAREWNAWCRTLSVEQAKALAAQLEDRTVPPDIADIDIPGSLVPYVQSIAKRDAVIRKLRTTWDKPPLNCCRWLETATGTRFERVAYLWNLSGSPSNPEQLVGIEMQDPYDAWFGEPVEEDQEKKKVDAVLKLGDVIYYGPSGQSVLARKVTAAIEDLDAASPTFEADIGRILRLMVEFQRERIVHWTKPDDPWQTPRPNSTGEVPSPPPINDLLFGRLFVHTIESLGDEGDFIRKPAEEVFTRFIRRVEREKDKSTGAYEFQTELEPESREAKFLPSEEELAAFEKAMAEQTAAASRPLPMLRWIGFVYTDKERSLHVQFDPDAPQPAAGTSLIVFPFSGKTSDIRYARRIARIGEDGAIEWSVPRLPSGMPVFIFETPTGS
ncbi:hypothetical protein JCM19992_35030 [Thermostilla marina]